MNASASPDFAPIERRSLADVVVERISSSIRDGIFRAGEALPHEELFSEQFGVSRHTVREAISMLIGQGLVERRRNRVHVVELLPMVQVAADQRRVRIREIFETRRLLEVHLAELAAQRSTDAQRRRIVAAAVRIRSATSIEQLRPLDRGFHAAVAATAGNALLTEMYAKVLDAVFATPPFDTVLSDVHTPSEVARILSDSAARHAAIAEAVVGGDSLAAGRAAAAHLDEVEQRILRR